MSPEPLNANDTWPKILRRNHEKYGDRRRAMRHKHYGIWQPYSWKDYDLNVKRLACGLLSLGFKPADKVLVIGDNAPEWYYAALAAQANHGAFVGMHSESPPAEIRDIAEDSGAGFAVVEDQEQVDKLLQIRDGLPLLKKVIYWNYKGLAHYNDPVLTGYRQVLRLGEKYEEENPGCFEGNVETGKADDVCAIVYTPGAEGVAPEGEIHTFGAMRRLADARLAIDPWVENDNLVPRLTPASLTGQLLEIGCHLLSASTLNFAEAPETHQRDTRETGPSIVLDGARFWESQAAMVQARMEGADAVKRFFFRRLMPVGYRMADMKLQKQKPGRLRKTLHSFADIALFRSIRRSLGLSNARICYSAGAPLDPDALRFYLALDLPLKSLYGSAERDAR